MTKEIFISPEKIRPPVDGRKWKRLFDEKGEKINRHFSVKKGHRERSDHHGNQTGKEHR
jgi:hypothetical protein